MQFDYNLFLTSLREAIKYIPVTLKLTFFTVIISLAIGILIGTIRHYRVPVISKLLAVFVTVYLGIPVVVALVLYNIIFMLSYEDIAAFFHIKKSISEVNPIIIAYFALILQTSCSISESVRGAFRGIDKVQYEASYSIGLTEAQTFFRIIIPQMVPILLPGLNNTLIGALKASNLVSAIGVTELMVAALIPCQETYSYLEGYIAAALAYWMIGICIELLAHFVEKNSSIFRKKVTC